MSATAATSVFSARQPWLSRTSVFAARVASLAESRERTVALLDDARRGGPHCSLAYQRRCWSTYRTLKREVESGRWGPVRAVTSHNVENWRQTIAGTWRDDPAANPGGFLGDALRFFRGYGLCAFFPRNALRFFGLRAFDSLGARAHRGSCVEEGTRISRLPFDCMGETMPARSICSIRRAARLYPMRRCRWTKEIDARRVRSTTSTA